SHPGHLLAEMEEVAGHDQVPIINRASIHFICAMLQYKGNISQILEIGTAIGYSTIWLAGISSRVEVDSLEKDPERYTQAKGFVQRAGLDGRVRLYLADAREYASQLNKQYDVI